MDAYQYQALQKTGKTVKGIIDADSERDARQSLRDKGLIPVEVRALKLRSLSTNRGKLSTADLSLLTRQLATLLAAGIPIEEALYGVSAQSEKNNIRQILIGVRSKVMEGYALAQAMSDYPNAFHELYRATVAAGEQTGKLDIVLEKLADYTENQQKTRQKIQQALIYPILMILVSTGIISFLLAFVVPKIIEVFTSSGQTLPAMTLMLIYISHVFKDYGLYLLCIFILLLAGFKRSLKRPSVKLRWHKLMLKLPIASYLIKSVNVARYIHTFSILFSAGVNILETMRVSAQLVNNQVMRIAFDTASIRVKEGTAISAALSDTHFLSPMATHLISSGEKSGQLASMMERAAIYMDDDVQRMIDTALTLLEPLVILLMGAMVLFIVLATLLPIFSMEQLVT